MQNRYDNPSVKVRTTSGDLDETEKAWVTNTGTVVKEGNTDMGTESNLVKEAITTAISKNYIDTVNKTEKSQSSNKTVDTFSRNKSDKGK